jgi:hypothetical protein
MSRPFPGSAELGHDFSRVAVFAGDRARFEAQDQTQSGGLG